MNVGNDQRHANVRAATKTVREGKEGGGGEEKAGELGVRRNYDADGLADNQLRQRVYEIGAHLEQNDGADCNDECRGERPARPVKAIQKPPHGNNEGAFTAPSRIHWSE